MDKELAQLFGNVAAIIAFIWIARRVWVKRPGILSNRLKSIKREREQDETAVPL